MKKRLYRWRFFLAVVVVILAGAGIWIFQKKSRTFVPATEVSLKGSLWNTHIAAAGGMEL